MHLQEIFDSTLNQGQGHLKHCYLYHVTNVPAKFLRRMVKEMHYQENTLVTQVVAHYPRIYVTYAPAKFDDATCHG